MRLLIGIAWSFLIAVGIAFLVVIVKPSETFKNCVSTNKNNTEYNELHEGNSSLVPTIRRFYFRSRLIGLCTADFADRNERSLSAFSAIALAVFTFYLWHATRGLRRFAKLQGDDMRQLVRLARANALAGIRAARSTRIFAEAARRQADAAEHHLTILERPYLYVSAINAIVSPLTAADASLFHRMGAESKVRLRIKIQIEIMAVLPAFLEMSS